MRESSGRASGIDLLLHPHAWQSSQKRRPRGNDELVPPGLLYSCTPTPGNRAKNAGRAEEQQQALDELTVPWIPACAGMTSQKRRLRGNDEPVPLLRGNDELDLPKVVWNQNGEYGTMWH